METRRSSALRLLGLARRAGAIAPGTEAVRRAIRDGEARLILMAQDVGSIPRVTLGDRATLGSALGMAELSAVAVTQASFANRLVEELERSEAEDNTDVVEA